jgi:hypothetical protein
VPSLAGVLIIEDSGFYQANGSEISGNDEFLGISSEAPAQNTKQHSGLENMVGVGRGVLVKKEA